MRISAYYGSGKVGMTSSARIQGKGPAAIVTVGDFLISVSFAVGIGYLIALWLMGPDSFRFGGYIGCLFVILGAFVPGVLPVQRGQAGISPRRVPFCCWIPLFSGCIRHLPHCGALLQIVSLASLSAAVVFPSPCSCCVGFSTVRILFRGHFRRCHCGADYLYAPPEHQPAGAWNPK